MALGRAGAPRGRLVRTPHRCVPLPVRMDENYNLLPHGVNFQDAVFPDTQDNRRVFASLFQFSNCSHGQPAALSSDWEVQEDSRVSVPVPRAAAVPEGLRLVSELSPEGSRLPFRPLANTAHDLGIPGALLLAKGSSPREKVG